MNQDAILYQDIESILYTRDQLKEAVRELGKRIARDYQGKAPVLICILKGASVFFCDLIREIDLPLEIEFMATSSYGASTVSSGEVKLVKDLDRSVLGRDVLLVEDIIDSGMTLNYLKKTLIGRGAASLRVVTLLDKPSRRVAPLTVDYTCFEIPDAFVIGYGLDYNERYRNMPDVCVLSPRIYSDAE
jgi:hypoxanthine phosphoribosyltransferase